MNNEKLQLPFSAARILSEDEAKDLVAAEPKKWNVVSIWSGGGGKHGNEKPELKDAKNLCQLRFHDIDKPLRGSDGEDLILCDKNHVKQILDFARLHYDEPIVFHCWAGISRSSAAALICLIDFFKHKSEMPVEDSLHFLSTIKSHHLIYPNRHIINLGIEMISETMDDGYYSQTKWMREFHNSSIFNKIYGRAFLSSTPERPNLKFNKIYEKNS